MGSVCSAGKAEKNKNKEVGGKALGKIKKLKSIAKVKGDCYSNPRTRKKNESEFRISNSTGKEGKQVLSFTDFCCIRS